LDNFLFFCLFTYFKIRFNAKKTKTYLKNVENICRAGVIYGRWNSTADAIYNR